MAIEVTTATAPAHWAALFVNGDESGYEDSEIAAAEAWAESLAPWRVVSVGEEAGFMRWHDAAQFCPYAADCAEFILHKTEEETDQ